MTVDEVMRLVEFMADRGVSQFSFGDLRVEFAPAHERELPLIHSDQLRVLDEMAAAVAASEMDPAEDLEGGLPFSDQDLFASADGG